MNDDYIRTLEERIEKLENALKLITIDKNNNVSFANCQIQAVGMEKCKNISVASNSIETCAPVCFKAKIDNSSIHNMQTTNGKLNFKNCEIYNKGNQ